MERAMNIVKMDYVAGVPTKIEANPCDTAIITFKVDANTAGARTGVITIGSANSQSSSSALQPKPLVAGISQH